ncbi:unnamed protein product [Acanthoscelides obtectus]|uniref:Uncharacterized protein n=1 Tax=Acanthoscelides obtectus TaxID=200917 RepID=A0A9P0VQT4_ACAOB|nr:unnamed protein product [Acanthoscelides obtectus]CAH2017682.1 unnamed protein product [Acanthoscelides obtectus]CAK1624622.1 hypothetical protein AOBTE_LOCUS2654 [Acanthoscelides obtectus]CAK1624624.1 hypothetical protein AOBTE_LOCUS2656 [Acanthoscelides obtectus]
MSDETTGAGQGALPPREGQTGLRTASDRPPTSGTTVRLTQVVGGQYVITSQPHGMPSLTQISPSSVSSSPGSMGAHAGQTGVTRIISISPSRSQSTSPLRPSVANQSIVNVLTSKTRPGTNVRLQLFSSSGDGQMGQTTSATLSPRYN